MVVIFLLENHNYWTLTKNLQNSAEFCKIPCWYYKNLGHDWKRSQHAEWNILYINSKHKIGNLLTMHQFHHSKDPHSFNVSILTYTSMKFGIALWIEQWHFCLLDVAKLKTELLCRHSHTINQYVHNWKCATVGMTQLHVSIHNAVYTASITLVRLVNVQDDQ